MRILLHAIFIAGFTFALYSGCDSLGQRKRPYGYVRLGKLADFQQEQQFLPDLRLLVRKDAAGYSAMSTLCTFDLSSLKQVASDSGYVWKSESTSSTYSAEGKVLTGPAQHDLPYYRMVLDQWDIKSPKNTLYVYIGDEQPASWRLKISDSPSQSQQ